MKCPEAGAVPDREFVSAIVGTLGRLPPRDEPVRDVPICVRRFVGFDGGASVGAGVPDLALARIVHLGSLLVEEEEPLIAHGAGPARPRRVVRRGYTK